MSGHTMRAVTIREFGGPEVLTPGDVARPEPLPTEVLVRVHAAGVNPVDWKTRVGQGMAGLQTFPLILGWDVSGVVEEVGFGVTTLRPGDEVYGMPWFPRAGGAYAEYVTAPARQWARKLTTVDHVHAAAVPLAALTAWQILVDTAHLRAGQRVLITAAAGGVGHLAVQFARHLGAHVIATASASRHPWLKDLGADETIDYTATPFEEAAAKRRRGRGPGRRRARPDQHPRPEDAVPGRSADRRPQRRLPDLAAAAEAAGVRATGFLVEPDGPALARIADLIDAGEVSVEVEKTFPLAEAAAAHAHGEAGHTRGKLVLTATD